MEIQQEVPPYHEISIPKVQFRVDLEDEEKEGIKNFNSKGPIQRPGADRVYVKKMKFQFQRSNSEWIRVLRSSSVSQFQFQRSNSELIG